MCHFSPDMLPADKIKVHKAELTEIYSDLNLKAVQEIIHKNGALYLLETGNHRIIRVENNNITNQIGRIGQSKGEFYYPKSFLIDQKLNFYVLDFVDKGANRVQILNSAGDFTSGFLTGTKTWGFGADSKGNVYLGQPHYGSLITVYNAKGKRINRFGELILPSEIYGEIYERKDKDYKIPMNRINIAVDDKDNIWAGLLFMPLLIKYNTKGEIILKKVLDLPGLTPLKKTIWEPSGKEARQYLSRNIDGYQMTVIIKEIIYNTSLKKLYLLSGSDEILILNPAGDIQSIIKPIFVKGALEKFFINENNEIIVKFFFHPECYKLNIKDFKNNKMEESK